MENSTFFLKITSVPPGEAPEWVREKWVGLTLPLAQQFALAQPYATTGVLTKPQDVFNRVVKSLTGKLSYEIGFLVDSSVAIGILAEHHPDAANWWRENTPHLLNPGQLFLFQEEAGTVVQ